MKLFLLLVGMVLVLEGLPYAAAPEAMKEWLRILSETETKKLRIMGYAAVASGLIICWIVQKTTLFA